MSLLSYWLPIYWEDSDNSETDVVEEDCLNTLQCGFKPGPKTWKALISVMITFVKIYMGECTLFLVGLGV